MYKILVIAFSKIDSDPRVRRQLEFLADSYEITTAGFSDGEDSDNFLTLEKTKYTFIEKLKSVILLKLRRYEHYYWSRCEVKSAYEKLRERNFDLIIANDVEALPLAIKLALNGSKVLLDAHEYSPGEFDENLIWRILFKDYSDYLCKIYLNKADDMITVCEGVADEYRKNYGVKSTVITNAANYQDLKASEVREDKIELIHHGVAIPSRSIELMIEVMSYLDEPYYLNFMLVGNKQYIEKLKALSSSNPRIRFIPPVNVSDIVKAINRYDIGLYLLPPNNLNSEMALPNKFFEFVQARLAIVIGPSTQMRDYVAKYNLGVVATDFTPKSMAKAIQSVSVEQIRKYKQSASAAAKELNSSSNKKHLLTLVENILGVEENIQ